MNPIFDTAMLKHHRVEYGKRFDTEGARRSVIAGRRSLTFATLAVLVAGLLTGINFQP
ncbi:MAG: hypothetical protein ABJI96_05345 [Paracoccaceae bacterium]